jgi:hypothetical protein
MNCEHRLNLIIAYPLSQHQLDALAFDLWPGISGVKSGLKYLDFGSPSRLLMAVNSGGFQDVANLFIYWVRIVRLSSKQHGRRQAEWDLLLMDYFPFQEKTSDIYHKIYIEKTPCIDSTLK